jgi:hypothetical protein
VDSLEGDLLADRVKRLMSDSDHPRVTLMPGSQKIHSDIIVSRLAFQDRPCSSTGLDRSNMASL